MIALIIGDKSFYLSQILSMRSFFSCCASFMKATNSFEGLGIRIVFVVSISIEVSLLFCKITTKFLLSQFSST